MENQENDVKKSQGLGVVVFLVIIVVVFGVIYYFMNAGKAGRNSNNQQAQVTTLQTPTPTVTNSGNIITDNIYMIKVDPTKGKYLADFQGMTLYIFTQDKPGISNCAGKCATIWPPYSSGATAQSQFPENITFIMRADGTKQFAWKGLPLYYYASDKKPGDILGDGVGGVWYLIKP